MSSTEIKTRAIVLRTVRYGESQVIVDMLTAAVGRVSFICHFSKTSKGKIRKQFFQPLTILDVVFDLRPTESLQHFRDLRVAQPFVSIPFDPVKLSLCLFVAEFLSFASKGEREGGRLEEFVEKSLEWLDSAAEGFANFHLVFMMRITLFVGFHPNLDNYSPGAWFDLREGTFTMLRPLHTDRVEPKDASAMRNLMRMTFDNMRLFRMSREERNLCTDVILSYYRLHVPGFPEMRSLDVLRELF